MLTPIIRVLTAKIIEVEPYSWLDFIEKSSKKLAPELRKVLNSTLQGKMWQKTNLYTFWWLLLALVYIKHLPILYHALKRLFQFFCVYVLEVAVVAR